MIKTQDIKPGFRAVFGSLGAGLSIFTIAKIRGDIITLDNGESHHVSKPLEFRAPFSFKA